MTPKPFATHRLANGWTVREYHSERQHAYIEPSASSKDGSLGRAYARFNRRHHAKILTIFHFIGSTEEEQQSSLRSARRWASRPHKFPMQEFWVRHRDPHFPGQRFYTIVIGELIDEVSAFEKLRRGLHTDDSIELEFQNIVQQMGATA